MRVSISLLHPPLQGAPSDVLLSAPVFWLLLIALILCAILTAALLITLRRNRTAPIAAPHAAFQQRAFHALLSISEAIDDDPTVMQVFQHALEAVHEATGFDAIAMRIYERDGNCFRLMAQRGMSPAMVQELACISADKGFQAEVMRTKQAAVSADLASDPRLGGRSPLDMGFRSLASVPLLASGELMGTMELASPDAYAWTQEQIDWLSLVGRSVGIFLHQAQLSAHLRDLAVLKERSLIAQEIHDGLAQLVGSVYVWAEDAQLSLQEGDTQSAQNALKKIDSTARDAYAVLREEILGLRVAPASGESLNTHLQEVLDRFQRQWGIEAHLTVTSQNGGEEPLLTISPAAEIQLLRILQEALTNIRRHSCAAAVHIKLTHQDGWLVFDVKDDGRGFEPRRVDDGRLGLSIMRERASSVGGRFQLQTQPGQGTRIRVELPVRSSA